MGLQNDPLTETRVRPMAVGDIGEVLTIASDAFLTPWTEQMFMKELCLSFSRNFVAVAGQGAPGPVAGFITFWVIADEVQLHNMAVRRDLRRRGVASRLFLDMIREALDQGADTGTLEVRPSNEAARRLYEKFGWRVTARRPSYYSDTGEDALIMSVALKACTEVLRHA
jgi:ribosomal-protein-alanine N-acetyltransferase